jgi:enoyl-CoA hydratase/carnithine racemase
MLADNLSAEEALAGGFLSEIVAPGALDAKVAEICGRLVSHAPVTMRVSKEAVRRVVLADVSGGDDLVRAAYGSEDFHEGVRAFTEKRAAKWQGR